jgi:CheY-like chemotaxis protein
MTELSRQVLVVDDDPDIRSVIELALSDEGYAVTMATNVQEALDRLTDWRPDVILLDLAMPIMDGWAFLAARQADHGLAAIPVIVMSAHFRQRGGDALRSAAAVLAKPFELDLMLSLIAGVMP